MTSGGDTQTAARNDPDAQERAAVTRRGDPGADGAAKALPDTQPQGLAERAPGKGTDRGGMRAPIVLGGNREIGAHPAGGGKAEDDAMAASPPRRSIFALNRSPLARKIIACNLLAMLVMLVGLLHLNRFPDDLASQREAGLATEMHLLANALETRLAAALTTSEPDSATSDVTPSDVSAALAALELPPGITLFVFDAAGQHIGTAEGPASVPTNVNTPILDTLSRMRDGLISLVGREPPADDVDAQTLLRPLLPLALAGETRSIAAETGPTGILFAAAAPLALDGVVIGAAALISAGTEIDALSRAARERILQMAVVAIVVAVALGLILAATIANPLSDLAAAAETGRDRHAGRANPDRVQIPDLTDRPDEIGRLSGAIRGMLTALYDRIDGNDQFAADVAHEIRNPLASLRSAVASLRIAGRPEQRARLLDVIEHDVRRLDRLLSDIASATRLESELVREEEESFDLMHTIGNLTDFLGSESRARGVDFVTDLPPGPIMLNGLEARLAQVFVNLIANAISFCEEGDAVRLWARRRENRILIVVEDTGPGIPEGAEEKIFERFYSERPEEQFGEHSGLGLAISKQIVEAHGGVIWAENIRPTDADITSEPLGARFIVGLPV